MSIQETEPHVASAQAASVLLDLLGPETFADEAVKYVSEHIGASLTQEQLTLVKVGAVKAALLVADEVRKFAKR